MNAEAQPFAAVFLAAGKNSRMGSRTSDKILAPLCGRPVLTYTIEAFALACEWSAWVFVARDKAQQQAIEGIIDSVFQQYTNTVDCAMQTKDRGQVAARKPLILFATGGRERQDSALAGLRTLAGVPGFGGSQAEPERATAVASSGIVFIHDCARPLVTAAAIRKLAEAACRDKAATLAHPVKDTIKEVTLAAEGDLPERCIARDIDRQRLWATETPQAFTYDIIRPAYEKACRENIRVTDDIGAAVLADHRVTLVNNPESNPKLTVASDFQYLEFLLQQRNTIAEGNRADLSQCSLENTGPQ